MRTNEKFDFWQKYPIGGKHSSLTRNVSTLNVWFSWQVTPIRIPIIPIHRAGLGSYRWGFLLWRHTSCAKPFGAVKNVRESLDRSPIRNTRGVTAITWGVSRPDLPSGCNPLAPMDGIQLTQPGGQVCRSPSFFQNEIDRTRPLDAGLVWTHPINT